MEHRAGIEIVNVEIRSSSEVRGVQDQTTGCEIGNIGSGDPEDIGSGAGCNFSLQLILIVRAFGTTGFVGEGNAIKFGIQISADLAIDVNFFLIVRAGAPADFNIFCGRCFGCGRLGGGPIL